MLAVACTQLSRVRDAPVVPVVVCLFGLALQQLAMGEEEKEGSAALRAWRLALGAWQWGGHPFDY